MTSVYRDNAVHFRYVCPSIRFRFGDKTVHAGVASVQIERGAR